MITVVFHEPENEENIGALARVMKNFGLKKLILINPKCKIGEKAYIVAKHAKDILDNAEILNDLEEALARFDLRIGTTGKTSSETDVFRCPLTPDELANLLKERKGKIGIFFGRESIGFSNDELKRFDIIVTIPASEEYPILNITHAAAIIFYEIFKTFKNPVREKYKLADIHQKAQIEKFVKEILRKVCRQEFRRKRIERAFHNLINKALITKREASLLTGFFRYILDHL